MKDDSKIDEIASNAISYRKNRLYSKAHIKSRTGISLKQRKELIVGVLFGWLIRVSTKDYLWAKKRVTLERMTHLLLCFEKQHLRKAVMVFGGRMSKEEQIRYVYFSSILFWRHWPRTHLLANGVRNLCYKKVKANLALDVGQKEFKDGRKSDVVYVPSEEKHSIATPPVLSEIQHVVDVQFLKRLTRYCLNIHDVTKVEPVVIVFAIQGSSSKAFIEDAFNRSQNELYCASKKYLWAKTCRFCSLDSISADTMSENSLKPVAALKYFLCSQKESIFGLEKK